jgi:hypothetical protein
MMASDTAVRTSVEATLHVWRTAAQAVATDPQCERRRAYEAAIALVYARLCGAGSMAELVEQTWNSEMWALAAATALHESGKVLNYQVIAAAACWQRMREMVNANEPA